MIEKYLQKNYPSGSIGAFMTSYFEIAFKGKDEATDFEKATTEIFISVFKYKAQHLGQTGSKSAPDILLISDEDGYQSIIDNKAYSEYSINGVIIIEWCIIILEISKIIVPVNIQLDIFHT